MKRRLHKRGVPPAGEEPADLGFGMRVSQEERLRLLNRDGSFNVARQGLTFLGSLSLYHSMLTVGWSRFLLAMFTAYVAINAVFAGLFLLCGRAALVGSTAGSLAGRFAEAFFFSIQTFTTVGYGNIHPEGLLASTVAALDAFVGLVGFALATGLLFARFSRPSAKIRFARQALVAPYRGNTAFEFRVANERHNVLIEVAVQVIFSRMEHFHGDRVRQFDQLALERSKVAFFPLQWVIVHPIDENSPMWGLTEEDLLESEAEFLILLTAIDDTFAQTVHTRSSYRAEEVVWGARYSDMFCYNEEGTLTVDLRRIDGHEMAAQPEEEPVTAT